MSDGVTNHTAEEVGVKSVLTALDLLDCFTVAEELGVSDAARRLGVAKSTAHRILTTPPACQVSDTQPRSTWHGYREWCATD